MLGRDRPAVDGVPSYTPSLKKIRLSSLSLIIQPQVDYPAVVVSGYLVRAEVHQSHHATKQERVVMVMSIP